MAIEKTLVLLKPCTMQRGLAGEIISIFEKKGLQICGMKMMMLTDELLSEHYSHLSEKPFFQRVKDAMMTAPVVAMCLKGVDAIAAVRALAGPTNGRNAAPGTIRLCRDRSHRAQAFLPRRGNHRVGAVLPPLPLRQRRVLTPANPSSPPREQP